MIKTLQTVGTEGTHLSIGKSIYNKPTANITLNGENLRTFPLRSGTRQKESTVAAFIQCNFGNLSYDNQGGKIKGIQV